MSCFEEIRKDFPIVKKLHYFDSAATCLKPKQLIEEIQTFYENEYATVHRAIYSSSLRASEKYEQTRKEIARFIGAASEKEIVFTKNTTESINLVAYSFGSLLSQGDEIILSVMEHHSNIVPWQMLAERKKLKLKFIPIDDKADLILEEYEKLLSSKTKMVAIGHVSNASGTVNPIEEIIKMAHKFGAKVLVDGAQAAAHFPIDVQKLNADFYVFSAHKMYGPNGVGVLYGKYDLLDTMPPFMGGGDMIHEVGLFQSSYEVPPLKFEAGTPVIAEVIAFRKSLEYIQNLGLENIQKHEQQLVQYTLEKLREIHECKIIGNPKKRCSIISFNVEGIHSFDLGALLDTKNIAIRTGHHCAQPFLQRFNLSTSCRISFGIYNTIEEVDYLIDTLKKLIQQFQTVLST